MVSDEKLLLEFCRGDRQAMGELITRYREEMLNFFYRRVDSIASAEDLVQELFLRVIRKADQFRAQARFSTWLYQIAINLLRNFYRQRKIFQLDPEAESEAPLPLIMPDFTEKIQLRTDIRNLLSQLKDEFRLILELTYFQELSTVEIADILQLPIGTVKSRRYHALRQLAQRIGEHEA